MQRVQMDILGVIVLSCTEVLGGLEVRKFGI